MIDFGLDETQQMLLETVRAFARDELRPQARAAEKARTAPTALAKRYAELGVALISAPEAAGGSGLNVETAVLIAEELGWGDPALAQAFAGPGPAGRMLLSLGSAAQQTAFLAPFAAGFARAAFLCHPWSDESDLANVPLKWLAEGNGVRVFGTLPAVVDADADRAVAVARPDGSGKLLAVVLEDKDLRRGERLDTCGAEVLTVAAIDVDAYVPADRVLEGDVAAAVTLALAEARLLVGARIVGAARAGSETAVAYAQERQAFGKRIGQFQGLAFMLADGATHIDAARNLLLRAAWALDRGDPDASALCAEAAAQAYLAGDKVATDSLQTHGGNGFVQDFPLEKWMRDIRTLSVLWGGRPQLDAAAVPHDIRAWSARG